MINPNPKMQVANKFNELFGEDIPFEVVGRRSANGRRYLTLVLVEGATVAAAEHSDWRKSYKMLKIEVEKLYADGLSLV